MGLPPWPGSSGGSDQVFPSRAWGRSSSSLAPPVHPTGSSRRGFSPVLSPRGLALRGPCLLVAPRPDVGVPTRVSSVPRGGWTLGTSTGQTVEVVDARLSFSGLVSRVGSQGTRFSPRVGPGGWNGLVRPMVSRRGALLFGRHLVGSFLQQYASGQVVSRMRDPGHGTRKSVAFLGVCPGWCGGCIVVSRCVLFSFFFKPLRTLRFCTSSCLPIRLFSRFCGQRQTQYIKYQSFIFKTCTYKHKPSTSR